MPKIENQPEIAAISREALAGLGGGEVAYVRAIKSEDINRVFPGTPPIAPGQLLFALLAADGSPILITDSRNTAIENAWEHDLTPVSVH